MLWDKVQSIKMGGAVTHAVLVGGKGINSKLISVLVVCRLAVRRPVG